MPIKQDLKLRLAKRALLCVYESNARDKLKNKYGLLNNNYANYECKSINGIINHGSYNGLIFIGRAVKPESGTYYTEQDCKNVNGISFVNLFRL